MNIRTYWKQEAEEKLSAPNPMRKITLFHSAVTLGISLLLALIGIVISDFVADTGGLSGIETRNMLQTAQSFLNSLYSIVQPFWIVGILFAYMCFARGQQTDNRSLLAGFRRIGPVFRLYLLKVLLLIVLAIPCAYVAALLTVNYSSELMALLEPVNAAIAEDPQADPTELILQIPLKELLGAMIPTLVVFGILYIALFIYLGCRLRFASYKILDDPKCGAIEAMRASYRMTRYQVRTLILLDLGFWFYYLLVALATVLAFADLLLPSVISTQWATMLCYSLYAAAMLGLDYTIRPKVETTYAIAYDALSQNMQG